MRNLGPIQQKALLLLLGGVTLGLSGSSARYFRILGAMRKEWSDINRRSLSRSIKGLYQSKLVTEKYRVDGSVSLVLTSEGRRRARLFQQGDIEIARPARWDGSWRIVLFDIPETKKSLRDVFRRHLQKIGFQEFQKSVFIFPYECEREIASLVKLYEAEEYFRFIVATTVSHECRLKKLFSLKTSKTKK
jgi:DNA-binding transcriptional regulator PaaX